MAAGVFAVAVTAVIVKYFLLDSSKKKTSPVTLVDPNVKYPLKLTEKEVQHVCSNYGLIELSDVFTDSVCQCSSDVKSQTR